MQLINIIALLAATASAAAVNKRSGEWTIKDFTRTCDKADKKCTYSYIIATPWVAQSCNYDVEGSPASRTEVKPRDCGEFQLSSAWSGQFGEGNGFTTFAVTNHKQIVWPAYADKQIENGKAVKPDQSYTPVGI
jgi:hypothetical protein